MEDGKFLNICGMAMPFNGDWFVSERGDLPSLVSLSLDKLERF